MLHLEHIDPETLHQKITGITETAKNYFDINIPVTGEDGIYWSHQLATNEGIITGISGGSTFAVAMKIADEAPEGSNILCMLADTAERYLTSALFEKIDAEMNDEENEIVDSSGDVWKVDEYGDRSYMWDYR